VYGVSEIPSRPAIHGYDAASAQKIPCFLEKDHHGVPIFILLYPNGKIEFRLVRFVPWRVDHILSHFIIQPNIQAIGAVGLPCAANEQPLRFNLGHLHIRFSFAGSPVDCGVVP